MIRRCRLAPRNRPKMGPKWACDATFIAGPSTFGAQMGLRQGLVQSAVYFGILPGTAPWRCDQRIMVTTCDNPISYKFTILWLLYRVVMFLSSR